MKRTISIFIFSLLVCVGVSAQDPADDAFKEWYGNKFSMFIHFGLYSHLGGVWEGEPVTQGYSEQIQSFAGIFSDLYAATAGEFNPVKFDAREVVSLAEAAGMRSVIFTAKHHDGFCMFGTSTTDYNSVSCTPSGRDYVRELSEACAETGMNFGLYFSLIDWNYPHACPISSHNADFITPEHHEFNKKQVRELLTRYGPVSELWFDMGSLQPHQSRELYDLVKEIQPDCMVSGRLGNDFYDFAVMADNKLPDVSLHAPWQSAASMFPETWSYRSWQERGSVDEKVAEKLRSLIDVVSRGGNYLLNIGPDADGAVVDFEREVLMNMGKWLKKNGEAIYDADPSPFRQQFEWGDVTRKGNTLYLLLTGTYPEDGYVRIPLRRAEGKVKVSRDMYSDPTDVHVLQFECDEELKPDVGRIPVCETMSWKNATPEYSYSCFDYYSNYRSTVAYNWVVSDPKGAKGVTLTYALSDIGRKVGIQVGDRTFEVTLSPDRAAPLAGKVETVSTHFGRMPGGTFDRPVLMEGVEWTRLESSEVAADIRPFSNHLMKTVLRASGPCRVNLSVTAGNGVELLVHDRAEDKYVSMMKHLNDYRTSVFAESVLLDLEKGDNEVLLRSYNRFEDSIVLMMAPHHEQYEYTQTVLFDKPLPVDCEVDLRIFSADSRSEHTDCRLHNIRIDVLR